MAQAHCPASCGELIQGWILGSEKLVSCPVDWYSSVEVTYGAPLPDERPLTRAMIRLLLEHWRLPASLTHTLRIDCRSTIPVAKGMASSTADIAATAVAAACHLDQPLDEPTLAKLCVALEPTDSTLFSALTLFDHHDAQTHIACNGLPQMEVLVLESPLTLTTADYHRLPRQQILQDNARTLDLAWQKLQQACQRNDPSLLGEATTLSAIASQALLPKPAFNTLLEVVERYGLYGLNVAHSGSVVGLLLDSARHDVDEVREGLNTLKLLAHWPQNHLLKMVAGGIRQDGERRTSHR
ncbi:L-threonine kinase [Kosakonia oryzendophytica]|uniref:L-threonine kinase n=1 Tax=Kosakonia oryzendophytica TaxID=1005665 RepID=A0A1C3YU98_9ENTR|nr:GHMP kinase [Kosakonia oryzendophytica]SCB73685.1 L-threonine kinase [Kosakonia oryzendophytica]